jgi:hypothetical protein
MDSGTVKNSFNAYDFLRDTYESSDGFSYDSDLDYENREKSENTTEEFIGSDSVLEKVKRDENYFNNESTRDSLEPKVPEELIQPLQLIQKTSKNSFIKPLEKQNDYKEKLNILASKVLGKDKESKESKSHNYCCSYCQTRNEVNFRLGRYSECKACESKKQIYRRNLRLKNAKESKGFSGTFGSKRNNNEDMKNSQDISPILLCSKCFELNKVCELCSKIQAHVQARALHKIQEYLCLSCGTNVSERFEQGYYSRCRACKNDYQVQKYKEAKLRSKELKEQLLSPAELEKLRVAKTIPSRVELLESEVQTLLSEVNFLKSELEEVKMENSSLKETMEDEFSDLKKQIKELKFIIRN